MRIGVDLDGVIFDSEQMFRSLADTYDKAIGGQGLVCPNELRVSKRYGWSKEQCQKFLDMCLYDVEDIAPTLPFAVDIINLLSSFGHEFVAITSRFRPKEIEITERRMKELGFAICEEQDIDIMIDDYYHNVDEVASAGITCIHLVPPPLKEVHKDNVFVCRNWGEIYNVVQSVDLFVSTQPLYQMSK